MRSHHEPLPTWGVLAPDDDISCVEEAAGLDLAALEAELPADLAALATQLQDDANHVAALYPARREVAPAKQSRRVSLRLGWAAAIALVVILGGAAAVGLKYWPAANQSSQVAVNQSRASEATPASPTPLSSTNTTEPQPINTDNVDVASPAEFTGFHDLTSPEQEALLDLLEHQNAGQASLSI